MATRNRTHIFLQYRNSAVSRKENFRNWANAHKDEDKIHLVPTQDPDPEFGNLHAPEDEAKLRETLPPEWVDIMEEIQYNVARIKQRMKELAALHDKHVNRPSLNDSVDEEHAIDIMTREITDMFHQSQREIQKIAHRGPATLADGNEEVKIRKNVMSALAKQLQSLSGDFRKGQSKYLKRLRGREEKEKAFFDTDEPATLQANSPNPEAPDEDELDYYNDKGFLDEQMAVLNDNTQMITEREQEIKRIAQSLVDVQDIFKELAVLIIDQGTILDRIDYNIEQVSVAVDKGVEELEAGTKYQKKAQKKMICLVLLVIAIIVMIFLLAFAKK